VRFLTSSTFWCHKTEPVKSGIIACLSISAMLACSDTQWEITASLLGGVIAAAVIIRGSFWVPCGLVYSVAVLVLFFPLDAPLAALVSPGVLKVSSALGLCLLFSYYCSGWVSLRHTALALGLGVIAGSTVQPRATGLVPKCVIENIDGSIVSQSPLYAVGETENGHLTLILPGERGTPWSPSHAEILGEGVGVFVLDTGSVFLPFRSETESKPIWTYLGGSTGIWPVTVMHTETLMKEGT